MSAFPTLASGSMVVDSSILGNPIAMYPMTSTTSWVTRIIRFVNDTEQSWTVRTALFSAQLNYHDVNGYDAARVEDFFHQQIGMWVDEALVNTFSMLINGTTYSWLVFDQDDLVLTENPNAIGRFSFTINVKQVRMS